MDSEREDFEKWADISGYEGVYRVSSKGRVKSLPREVDSGLGGIKRLKGRMLKAQTNPFGYQQLELSKGGVRKTHTIHRLVAEAFLLNPENLPAVNHIDGVKANNRASNLEWCTYGHNMKEAFRLGLQPTKKGEGHHRAKLTKAGVIDILKSDESIQILAERYRVSRAAIRDIRNRRRWAHVQI